MVEMIPAIYEDGIFKPLHKVNLPDHKHVHITLMQDEEVILLNAKKKELSATQTTSASRITKISGLITFTSIATRYPFAPASHQTVARLAHLRILRFIMSFPFRAKYA